MVHNCSCSEFVIAIILLTFNFTFACYLFHTQSCLFDKSVIITRAEGKQVMQNTEPYVSLWYQQQIMNVSHEQRF